IATNFSGHKFWYVYDDSIGVHFHEECVHWLYYWTKDNVCHHTPVHMQVYHVDEYNPEVTKHYPDHGYYTPVSVYVKEPFENDSASNWLEGAFYVNASWQSDASDGNGWIPYPSGQYITKTQNIVFNITNNDQNHDLLLTLHIEELGGDAGISLKYGDNIDNNSYTILVNRSSSKEWTLPVYDNLESLREGEWHWWAEVSNVAQYLKAGANITLTANDPGICPSGIEGIYWRYVWEGTEHPLENENEYGAINGSIFAKYGYDENITSHWWYVSYGDNANISFDNECEHTLYYFAKDRACHNSTVHQEVYFVDDSVPLIKEKLPKHGAIGNATVSLEEDFEVPFVDWYNSGGWYRISKWWPYDDNMPYEGRYCAYGEDGWLISPRIDIPSDGNLTFWYQGNGEFEVNISTDPDQDEVAAFATRVYDSGSFIDGTYRKVEIDLSAYTGQSIYIGFHVLSGEVYIDNVWVGSIHKIDVPFEDDVEDSVAWDTQDLTIKQQSYWMSVRRLPVGGPPSPGWDELMPDSPAAWCGDLSMSNAPNGGSRYGCNWNDTLTMLQSINLSNATGPVTLEFNIWYYLENNHDYLYVEVSNDSINWTTLKSYTGSCCGWYNGETVDLSSYIGNKTVWVRFRFVSDDSYSNIYNGVFIDNVSIYNSTKTFFLQETFDDLDRWDAQMLPTSRWHVIDTEYHSTNHSWWNGNDARSEYLNCSNDALITPQIDLTGYTGHEAMLTFWHKYAFNTSDYGYVEISEDGTIWDTLATYSGTRGWVQQFINISDYVGHNVYIRFRFYSNNSVVDDGWYIDNVRVEIRDITGTEFEDGFERTFPPAGWTVMSYGDY
ncbi:MAG: hypothetical protein DRN16_04775, partial [Thermoplasmata archaeon]